MNPPLRPFPGLFVLTALSLSIGWGIRGNFGHEFGALIPGALAAMAAALLSDREDWHRRVGYFGFFGAIGWSFGGSISYMQVIGFTHSGHSPSVLYGFACLFVIGFLWGALGGAGTALPVFLNRDQLTEFFAPLTAVFIAWILQGIGETWLVTVTPEYRQQSPLYWFDTDWLAAFLAIVAMLALALLRRRWDDASSLILHLAIGWWCGFLVLVVQLGWRMTQPRGDNWAGCVGMVAGLLVYLRHRRWWGLIFATLTAGFVGGFGFAGATLFKLIEVKSGWYANWHSVLEQTYGFINGLGIALVMFSLARRAPIVNDDPPIRRWTEVYSVGFILVGITWLNLRRNPSEWIKAKAFPDSMYGWPTLLWYHLGYAVLAASVIWLLIRHVREPFPFVPPTWLGKGQLLYLVFLWWMVTGNLDRSLPAFAPQRLVTEGVIHLNAVICTALIALCPGSSPPHAPSNSNGPAGFEFLVRKAVMIGTIGFLVSSVAEWGIVRTTYGDQFAGHAGKHIRFGPNATTASPPPGNPHP